LTIGTKSAPSSTRDRRKFGQYDSTDGGSEEVKRYTNVPTGQGYMQKLVGSLNDLDDDIDDDYSRMGMFYFC